MANTLHYSRAQACTRSQTYIHMGTCTNTHKHTHTESLSGIFAENLKKDLTRIGKTYGK
jgi:hypothetical protein